MLKPPAFARVHTRRMFARLSFIASWITRCFKPRCRHRAASVHQCHKISSGTAAAAFSPNSVVNRFQIWVVENLRSREMKAIVSHSRRLIVSHARCATALSCSKKKNSPEISCTARSSY